MIKDQLQKLYFRAWGLWQDPIAEILGLKLTRLSGTQTEISFTNPDQSPSRFLKAAELALNALWRKRLGRGEKMVLTQCNFELIRESLQPHFVARSELLENDRETEDGLVLIFDLQNHLVARVQCKVEMRKEIVCIQNS